jgi:hypothetical protein
MKQDYEQQKSKLGTKMMNLAPNELTTNKQDTIEHIEINRATKATYSLEITPRVNKLKQEQM